MGNLLQDLSYGSRMLLKRRGFTVVVVLALALGIGANSAIFSVVNAVLLRPLPFAEPERLVQVWEYRPRQGLNRSEVAAAEFVAWREQNHVFEQMAAITYADYNLTGGDQPERIPGARVSANYFTLLGVRPAQGRTFLPEEEQGEHANVVVLGYDLWNRRFGADPQIINRTLMLNGKACTVVGVMPRGFQLPQDTELARPLALTSAEEADGGSHYLEVQARLKPGVTIKEAAGDMSAIAGQLEQNFQQKNIGHGVVLVPLHEQVVGDVRPALLVLLGAVGCVLLIACANVANLLLARAASRRKELAIRTALGASRWRIIRQLLTESLLLSLLGGGLGLLLAMWGVDLLTTLSPNSIPRATEVSLDARVLGFTCLLSLLTGVLFGLIPAVQASRRPDLTESLKDGDRGSTEGYQSNRARSLLIISEFALTLVLLVGAGLLLKSFWRLREVNPGFNPSHVLTLDVSLPAAKYPDKNQVTGFYQQLLPRVGALPGVERVGAVSVLPLSGNDESNFVSIEGQPPLPPGEALRAGRRYINADYFRAMEIPFKRGRLFGEGDTLEAPPVMIINETMARRFFQPNEDPVGKRIRTSRDPNGPLISVVGVVGDVKHRGLEVDTRPEMFFPYTQASARSMTLVIRTAPTIEPKTLAETVRKEVLSVDRDQPVGNVKTLEQLLAESVAPRRFSMLLLAIFASVALLLAAVGIYGVISYSVTQRTHEIGIRLALGAQQGDILKLVVGQGLKLALIGLAVGLLAGGLLTRAMSSLLFGVSATDPLTFAVVSLVLGFVAFFACYIPARRATKVDPMVALRYE